MVVTDYNTQFLDRAGTDHLIDELKAYVDDAVVNLPTGGGDDVDLSNYYTKTETYNKEEVDNLIPTVTDGQDGQDGEDGFSPVATVTKAGKIATITITDKNGTTTASVSDGKDGTGGGSSGGGEIYSMEETTIGTWIDGRTIYRKTFQATDLVNNTMKSLDVDVEFDAVINVSAMGVYTYNNVSTYYPFNISLYNNLNISSNSTTNITNAIKERCFYVYIEKRNTGSKIYIWSGTYGKNMIVYVTIDYIKAIGGAVV